LSTVFLDADLDEEDVEAREERAIVKRELEAEPTGLTSMIGNQDFDFVSALPHKLLNVELGDAGCNASSSRMCPHGVRWAGA